MEELLSQRPDEVIRAKNLKYDDAIVGLTSGTKCSWTSSKPGFVREPLVGAS